MKLRRDAMFRYAGLLTAAVGLVMPLVAFGLLLAAASGTFELFYYRRLATVLLVLFFGPVLLVPLGIGIYAYGNLASSHPH